jgi:hypothetical protein
MIGRSCWRGLRLQATCAPSEGKSRALCPTWRSEPSRNTHRRTNDILQQGTRYKFQLRRELQKNCWRSRRGVNQSEPRCCGYGTARNHARGCSRISLMPWRRVNRSCGHSLTAASNVAWAMVTWPIAAMDQRTCFACRSHSSTRKAMLAMSCRFGFANSRRRRPRGRRALRTCPRAGRIPRAVVRAGRAYRTGRHRACRA